MQSSDFEGIASLMSQLQETSLPSAFRNSVGSGKGRRWKRWENSARELEYRKTKEVTVEIHAFCMENFTPTTNPRSFLKSEAKLIFPKKVLSRALQMTLSFPLLVRLRKILLRHGASHLIMFSLEATSISFDFHKTMDALLAISLTEYENMISPRSRKAFP